MVLEALRDQPRDVAGVRLDSLSELGALLGDDGPVQRVAARHIGKGAFPVRALLFDKTEQKNWSLAWHQDRTIVVRSRHETSGYGPWSTKAGLLHVAPPFRVLERMATLRVHLDDVDQDNAPLMISAGSHRLGRIAEAEVPAVVERLGAFACLAKAGDVWAYSTPVLHSSDAAAKPRRRRVLQLDYANFRLDDPLEWHGLKG